MPGAFLAGLSVAVPLLLSATLLTQGLLARVVTVMAWLLFLVAWFLFVHGPGQVREYGWYLFGWIPNDGVAAAAKRGCAWLAGVGVSIAVLEAIRAI